jgi:hypothetical protein
MWTVCNYGCIICMNAFWMCNFFYFFNNLAVTGNTNMRVIGNEYTSDGQHKYACQWYRITSDGRKLPVTSNLLPVTVYQ